MASHKAQNTFSEVTSLTLERWVLIVERRPNLRRNFQIVGPNASSNSLMFVKSPVCELKELKLFVVLNQSTQAISLLYLIYTKREKKKQNTK